jgi:hypothetical protein
MFFGDKFVCIQNRTQNLYMRMTMKKIYHGKISELSASLTPLASPMQHK